MDITEEADVYVDSLREQIVKRALKGAEEAHHNYEQETLGGVRDEKWADWYAQFLKGNTEQNLFETVDESVISQALETATKAQVFHKDYTWEEFAASYIVHYLLQNI